MPSRSGSKARFAAIALVILCSSLVAVLAACPPSSPKKARPTPEGATGQPQPSQPSPQPREPQQEPQPQPQSPQPEQRGMLAVIIDDAGYDLDELAAFLSLPGALTIAVLPNLPHSQEAARRVISAGKDLLLHCPMEAEGGENPGPGALATGQDSRELESRLAAAFESVPGAIGMNNHMGSKATADPVLMATVMGWLKLHGKIYVDSRTSAKTVGPREAARAGVPFLERDVFIDAGRSEEEIQSAWAAGIAEAKARGSAVLIGHVQNPAVAAILRGAAATLAAQGVRLGSLAEVMAARGGGASR
jgi:polysaccharide deacetylase 2 family uncharacterized protein YibQ